jgi:hypothetical protein
MTGVTPCQKIVLALLEPRRALTVRELAAETGIAGRDLVPVLNRMIGIGSVVVCGNRVSRLTFKRAGGF